MTNRSIQVKLELLRFRSMERKTERIGYVFMIHTDTIPCFDLKQIAESGQCFRMNALTEQALPKMQEETGPEYGYRVISRGKVLKVYQKGQEISFDCDEENLPFWIEYFDIGTDYQAMIDSVAEEDLYLTEAARAGSGIRILRQDPWEMIITFVISQQKTIPKIRELTEALCSAYGTLIDVENGQRLYAFPSPRELSAASLEELQELKLGYRAKYIHRLCQDAVSGELDLKQLTAMDYEEAMAYLTGFYGIGKKVANCVCLFGLHHIGAFPVDTWIEKILMTEYYDKRKYRRTPKTCLCDTIVKNVFGQYGGCAGVMQQYIFNFERNVRHRKS